MSLGALHFVPEARWRILGPCSGALTEPAARLGFRRTSGTKCPQALFWAGPRTVEGGFGRGPLIFSLAPEAARWEVLLDNGSTYRFRTLNLVLAGAGTATGGAAGPGGAAPEPPLPPPPEPPPGPPPGPGGAAGSSDGPAAPVVKKKVLAQPEDKEVRKPIALSP